MVIVKLMGGLGNQMFQYAVGRSLALHHRTTLKLDLSWYQRAFSNVTPRTYQLDKYTIQANAASRAEIERITWSQSHKTPIGLLHYLQQKLHIGRPPIIREIEFGVFQPEIFKTPRTAYLSGYWQSERYFRDRNSTIRTDFTVAVPPDETNQDMMTQMRSLESVSLHIRRGDYVSNPGHAKHHGVLPITYYENAVQYIASQVGSSLHFFVFSDDPNWVSHNLSLPYPMTLVNHNPATRPEEDLRLMSHCKHHIIANSSFSWWGAWLSDHPSKQVIAPKIWFAQWPMPHTVPDEWYRI